MDNLLCEGKIDWNRLTFDEKIQKTLKSIPKRWNKIRLKYFIKTLESGNRQRGGGNLLDEGVFSIGGEHISWEGKITLQPPKFISEEFYSKLNSGKIKQNDILLVKDGATIGKAAIIKHLTLEKCAVNEHVFILRSNDKTIPEFLFYLIRSELGQSQILSLITGAAQPGLSSSFINNTIFPHPPLSEQRAIADFLDYHTARIDALIEKQERLIDLLEEKRNALIAQAVTKGMDPNVEMKESGLPTIGKIPAHWEVLQNKWIYKESKELSTKGDEDLLSVSHITGVSLRSEKSVNMFMAETLVGYKKCSPNDLVINTMWAWMGALGISFLSGVISPSYNIYRIVEQDKFNFHYLDYLYRTPNYISEINRYSKGVWSSRLRLYPDEFLEMETIIPPKHEQDLISAYISEQLENHNNIIRKITDNLRFLNEYRKALISACVLGKIDVRDWREKEVVETE